MCADQNGSKRFEIYVKTSSLSCFLSIVENIGFDFANIVSISFYGAPGEDGFKNGFVLIENRNIKGIDVPVYVNPVWDSGPMGANSLKKYFPQILSSKEYKDVEKYFRTVKKTHKQEVIVKHH